MNLKLKNDTKIRTQLFTPGDRIATICNCAEKMHKGHIEGTVVAIYADYLGVTWDGNKDSSREWSVLKDHVVKLKDSARQLPLEVA